MYVIIICKYEKDPIKNSLEKVETSAFCIFENKDADHLRGNRKADQRLCFRYINSTIPLLFKSKISSLWQSSVAVQPGLVGNPEDRFSHVAAHILQALNALEVENDV